MRIALAAVAALTLSASPAAAQIWGGPGGNAHATGRAIAEPRLPPPESSAGWTSGVSGDLRKIRESIRNGRESGQLTRREARALRRETARIGSLQNRYGRGGLSVSESSFLAAQVEGLRGKVVAKRSN
jgi:hypothetical protein